MYTDPSWTHQDFLDIVKALTSPGSHFANYYAELLHLDDTPAHALPPLFVGGGSQIAYSNGQDSPQGFTVQVAVADPSRSLANYEGAAGRRFMVRIHAQVDSDSGVKTWMVGTFPIIRTERNDAILTYYCVSKAFLAQYNPREAFTVPAGVKMTEAILRIMAAAGESRALCDVPDLPRLLKEDVVVQPASPENATKKSRTFMATARELANQLGYVLFYRPDGKLLMRKLKTTPVWTFATGADGNALVVKPTADFSSLFNRVRGMWGTKLKETPVVVEPPPGSPFFPGNIGRRDVAFVNELVLEFPHEHHASEVTRQCKDALHNHLKLPMSATATVFPFPFLEQYDMVALKAKDYHGNATPSWTLSLEMGAPMSLNWTQYQFVSN